MGRQPRRPSQDIAPLRRGGWRPLRLVLPILLVLAAARSAALAQPASADPRLAQAEARVAAGDVTGALADVRALLRDQPTLRRARLREAQLLSILGRLASAHEVYQRFLKEFPDDAEARTGLGLTCAWRGQYREADALFNEVLNREPDRDVAFYAHLRVLAAQGQPTAAWQAAWQRDQQSSQRDPELGLILAQLAARIDATDFILPLASRPTEDADLRRRQLAFLSLYKIRRGQLDAGLELARQFAHPDSADYDALVDAGNSFAAAELRPEARLYYERAARLTPQRGEAFFGLARLASREGRLSGSLGLYQQVVNENPESLEGWLGIIRTARMLNEPALAADAVERAWSIAPRSALVYREDLRAALQNASLATFQATLDRYLADQPADHTATWWQQAWLQGQGLAPEPSVLERLLDPLAPDLSSQALSLLVPASPSAALARFPAAPQPALETPARLALAERLALLLQPDLAAAAAAGTPPSAQAWIEALASGWWAYLSEPWAARPELARTFDDTALAVWLAGQVQRRLRTLAIDTESDLEERWWMARAAWLQRWRAAPSSEPAAEALVAALSRLASGWAAPVTESEVHQAWLRSERQLDPAYATLGWELTLARWAEYRHDPTEALRRLERLRREFPEAAEPRQRSADLLQATGRASEAAGLYDALLAAPLPSPSLRLGYAGLLIRLGRHNEARRQLQLLADTGFDEAEYYAQRAKLADAAHLPGLAWDWLDAGLKAHPHAPGLLSLKAEWLLRQDQGADLAELLVAHSIPGWIDPDYLAAAGPYLPGERLELILGSAPWWFTWRWLPWERLGLRSLDALERHARAARQAGQADLALASLQPALSARIPDAELWLRAALLQDQVGQPAESQRSFRAAFLLDLGRPDARVAELLQLARRRPADAARALRQLVDEQPDDPAVRLALVVTLLRAGEVNSADLALAPLLETRADDTEVQLLAARVAAAKGDVQRARSLYHSVLRNDPLAADARSALLAVNDQTEWGLSAGYEYSALRPVEPGRPPLEPWQEAFLNVFWQQPLRNTYSVEYHWYQRTGRDASQLIGEWTHAAGRDWLLRAKAGVALDGTIIPRWRLGAGASYQIKDPLIAGLDAQYLDYSTVDVFQVIPSLTWRWHPRGTLEAKVYISENDYDYAPSTTTLTYAVRSSWQLGRQSLLMIDYAGGDEDSENTVPGLIGREKVQSVGGALRLGWYHQWSWQVGYRYEWHEKWTQQTVGTAIVKRF